MPPSQKQARLQVRKIPLDYTPIIHKPNFPPMPILYLELVENKKKVKPELRNKDYVPRDITAALGPSLMEAEKLTVTETFRLDDGSDSKSVEPLKPLKLSDVAPKKGRGKKGPIGIIDLSKMSADEISQMAEQKAKDQSIEPFSSKGARSEYKTSAQDDSLHGAFPRSGPSLDDEYQRSQLFGKQEALSRLSRHESRSGYDGSRASVLPSRNRDESNDDKSDEMDRRERRGRHREESGRVGPRREQKEYFVDEPPTHSSSNDRERSGQFEEPNRDDHYEPREPQDSRSNEDDSASKKDGLAAIMTPAVAGLTLEAVLSGKAPIERYAPTGLTPPSNSQPSGATTSSAQPPQRPSGMPPTLKEIQEGKVQTNKNGTRDMRFVTPEEVSEESEKRDIFFKFKILRKQYKGATIPDFSEHTPLSTLKREYEQIVRQLALDATVENYKKYLTIGFYVLEFVVGNFFRVEEIKGFATSQMVGMNQYERILYLIGEQAALSGRKSLPPIVQLIIAIMINGAIYVGGKFFLKATGLNIMGMMNPQASPQPQPMQNPGQNGFTAFPSQHSHAQPGVSRPGRMRQPDVDLDEITGKKNV
jgi:hypothetical protein